MNGCVKCERGRRRDPHWPRPVIRPEVRALIKRVTQQLRPVLERLAQHGD